MNPRRRRAREFPASTQILTATIPFAWFGYAASVDDDDDDDDGSDSSGSGGVTKVMAALKNEGDAVLIARKRKFWSSTKGEKICDKAPFVFSKDGASNKNCLDVYNEKGFSCTCLSGFDTDNPTWEFHVEAKKRTAGTPEDEVNRLNTISVTKIAPFILPAAVTSVRILGKGPGLNTIEFMQDVTNKGVLSDPKIRTAKGSDATLGSVYIENLDLSTVARYSGFFESSLTNLTLKNCNLRDGDTGFLSSLGNLVYLNLGSNQFTKIPSEIFGLGKVREVFLGANAISNVSLTDTEYQAVMATSVFTLDSSASATGKCTGGNIREVGDVSVCVLTNLNGSPSVTTASTSNTSLLIGVICSCSIIVAILVFLLVRRRSSRQKEEAFVKQQTQSILDDTLSYVQSTESHQSVDSSLLNDPIIITHRIPYNDVKVATCISRGGFGLVYSGTFNRRRVAIKKIRSELSADIKYIESFLKEICLMASLSHPRIVEFIGVSWDSLRNLSAVTEFMERGDLRDVLHSAKARDARLTWDGHKARIAMHIAEALTYLHSLSPKVIHRDLKSKNVLLDNDMTAKLSDFGVSRERRFEETHMTAGIGTAFWIAPEVLLGMDYDEHADIFSYGVVLSEIDTDDYPYWNEKNPASGGKQQENVILRMVATGALRPEFSPTCPSPILELAHACLDVDPQKRPTAAEIVYRLQQLIRSSPLTPDSVFSTE